MLTIGSLFAGYGGLDIGIEQAIPARTAWVSEIDPGACKVLAHRYPDVPNHGDITRIDWATVEPVDIIAGGSPCQDLSTAGRRAGMTEGTRSNLWVQMREAIAHVQPTFVVWENVRGALSAHAASDLEPCAGCVGDGTGKPSLRALGRVLGDLADLGFDAEWRGLRAADVGACHGRFRVFLLAWRRAASADADHAGLQGHADSPRTAQAERHGHAEPGAGGSDLTLLPTPAVNDMGEGKTVEWWDEWAPRQMSSDGRPAPHGKSLAIEAQRLLPQLLPTPTTTQRGTDANLDTREGARANLHNAVVQLLPTPRAQEPGSTGVNAKGGPALTDAVRTLLPTPSVADAAGGHERRGGARSNELLLKGIAKEELSQHWGDYAAAIARHEHATGRPAPAPTEPGPKGNPRLAARFVEWMMMLPAGWITDVPDITRTQALRMLGNGVVPNQAAAALRHMVATRDNEAPEQ